MSDLPAGWVWAELAQLCTSITDGDHQPPPQVPVGIPFLVIGNIRRHVLDFADCRHVPPKYFKSLGPTRRPQKWDVLYSLVGATYGISVLVKDDTPFCVQRHIGIIRPSNEISSAYLALAMSSRAVYNQATRHATGTAQPTVPLSGLRRIQIPLPPRPEQDRIVVAIEEQFSRLDAGGAALRRAQQNLKRARAAVLEQLTWANFDGSRQAVPLASLIESARTGLDRGRARQRMQPPGCGYVKMADVREGVVDLSRISYVDASADEIAIGELYDGDILFNNRNSRELVGKSGLVVSPPAGTLYNNNLVRLRLREAMLPKFMALQLCSPSVLRQLDRMKNATTNVAAIYTRDLLTLQVNTPSPATQRMALHTAEYQLAVIDNVSAALEIGEQRAARLRSSLLTAAFSGRPSGQDPTDEPASILLQRIAAERASLNGHKSARAGKPGPSHEKVTS
jgi:hypothetical protein